MKPHLHSLLVLLMTGSGAMLAAPAMGQQAGASEHPLDVAEVRTVSPRSEVLPRAKIATVGAELAEKWSPILGTVLARYAASPTVDNEIALAREYYVMGILDQAYEHYRAVTERNPRQGAAWDGRARIWRDWGYPGFGLGDAYRAVWADPRSPTVRNTLGMILFMLGRYREAGQEFARAASFDPSAEYAQHNLGLARAAGDQEGAAPGKGVNHERR